MAEYIDLGTPLEVYVMRGGFCEQQITTLRELLDVNHLRYEIADVRPVVWGKWIYGGQKVINETFPIYTCSNCKKEIPAEWERKCNYCPNCGADMREES